MNHQIPSSSACPSSAWLDQFANKDGISLISENRPFAHAESAYDDQYAIDERDESGLGIVNLLRRFDADVEGPVLELGCGTGRASIGLCKTAPNPWLLITDSSTAFIDITRRKMTSNDVDLSRVRFALLSDSDLHRLPAESVSAIVLESVLHHFLDVPGWIQAAARILRPGGVILAEEPCASGYLLMGIISQSVASTLSNGLSPAQRGRAQFMADTMKGYSRRDQDKSSWEDKHLFRPEEMMVWARDAGLECTFLPNGTFKKFAANPQEVLPPVDFRDFFETYLNLYMSFGPVDAAAMAREAEPLVRYVIEACAATREPYLMGTFAFQKSRRP